MTFETEDGSGHEKVSAVIAGRQATLCFSKYAFRAMPLFGTKVCCERKFLSSRQEKAVAGFQTDGILAVLCAKPAFSLLHDV